MEDMSTNIFKGSLYFVGAYLIYKSLARLCWKSQPQKVETANLYSQICTFSMGMTGTALAYTVYHHN